MLNIFYMIRLIFLPAIVSSIPCAAQLPAGLQKCPLSTFVMPLKRVVWTSAEGVENSGNLLKPKSGQAVLNEPDAPLILKPGAGVVLDFGVELQGSLELFTPQTKSKDAASVRIRFNPHLPALRSIWNEPPPVGCYGPWGHRFATVAPLPV